MLTTSACIFDQCESGSEFENYAIEVLLEARQKNPGIWNASWENEYLLGKLCQSYGMNIDEQCATYYKAYSLCSDPPVELLIAVADCRHQVGASNSADEEAEVLSQRALAKNPTDLERHLIEQRLRNISISRKNVEKEKNYLASMQRGYVIL